MFSKLGITAKWWWKRIEYHKRGTSHGYGCFCLYYDPGMSEAAKRVLEERILEMLLNKFQDWESVCTGILHVKFPETSTHSDEWDNTILRPRPDTWDERICTEHALKV